MDPKAFKHRTMAARLNFGGKTDYQLKVFSREGLTAATSLLHPPSTWMFQMGQINRTGVRVSAD